VTDIDPKGSAAGSQIQKMDIIREVDRKEVNTVEHYLAALSARKKGQPFCSWLSGDRDPVCGRGRPSEGILSGQDQPLSRSRWQASDGYHELRTIMVPLSFGDDVFLDCARSGIASMPGTALCSEDRNLAYRAARLFFERTGRQGGISISITKRIPSGPPWRRQQQCGECFLV
jgi:hypothetical protein